MVNVEQLGRALKRFFASSKSYKLLDTAEETAGTTWSSGGCWSAAQALHSVLPGSKLRVIKDQSNVVHHVLVEYNGWFLDADGASSAQQLLRRWTEVEHLSAPRIAPFVLEQVSEGLVCPVELVRRLRIELKKLLV